MNYSIKQTFEHSLINIKKEIWEYKGALVWLPLVLVSLFLVVLSLEAIFINDYQVDQISFLMNSMNDNDARRFVSQASFLFIHALFSIFLLFAFFVQLRYFISCLFDERKDLSIFFWRSMPVSDALVITVKLVTGALIIPFVFLFAAFATLLIGIVVLTIAGVVLGLNIEGSIWTFISEIRLFSASISFFLAITPIFLWLFPLYAWLMLASMFASKVPFLWATLPIVFVVMLETFLVSVGVNNSLYITDIVANYFDLADTAGSINIQMHMNNLGQNGTSILEQGTSLAFAQAVFQKVSIWGLLLGSAFLAITYWLRVNRSHD